jgi:hypothetical protein
MANGWDLSLFDAEAWDGVDAPATDEDSPGGDDSKHTGWNKREWQKRQKQELAIEETILKTYQQVMGIEPPKEVIREVKQEVIAESPKPVTFDYSGVQEWLAAQQRIVNQIVARKQEEDDEEALLLLL